MTIAPVSAAVSVAKAQAVADVSGVQTQYTYSVKEQSAHSSATLNHAETEQVYDGITFTTVAEGDGLIMKVTAAETANSTAAETAMEITFDPLRVLYPSP